MLLKELFDATELEQEVQECDVCLYTGHHKFEVPSGVPRRPPIKLPVRQRCQRCLKHTSVAIRPPFPGADDPQLLHTALSIAEAHQVLSGWAAGGLSKNMAREICRSVESCYDFMKNVLESGPRLYCSEKGLPLICRRLILEFNTRATRRIAEKWCDSWVAAFRQGPEWIRDHKSHSQILVDFLSNALERHEDAFNLGYLKDLATGVVEGSLHQKLCDIFRIAECQEQNSHSKFYI